MGDDRQQRLEAAARLYDAAAAELDTAAAHARRAAVLDGAPQPTG